MIYTGQSCPSGSRKLAVDEAVTLWILNEWFMAGFDPKATVGSIPPKRSSIHNPVCSQSEICL